MIKRAILVQLVPVRPLRLAVGAKRPLSGMRICLYSG
jgi:hypothetical protein